MATKETKALLSAGRFREAGELMMREGDIKGAIKVFEKGKLWTYAGRLHEKSGKFEKAFECYRKGGSHKDMARIYRKAGQYEDAGKEYASAGDNLRAADCFKLAYENTKNSKTARICASFYARSKQPKQAAHMYMLAGEHAKAAEAFLKGGMPEDAAELYMKYGYDREAAEAFVQAGKFQKAAKVYTKKGDPGAAGRLYMQAGNFKLAVEILEKEEKWEDAAKAALALKDFKRAASNLQKAGRVIESAKAYIQAGEYEQAIKSLVPIKFTSPNYIDACKTAIYAMQMMNDVSYHAETFLDDFLKRKVNADIVDAMYALAGIYQTTGFWENAEEIYQRIHEFDPKYKDVDDRLKGVVDYRKESLDMFKKVMKDDFDYDKITDRLSKQKDGTVAAQSPGQPQNPGYPPDPRYPPNPNQGTQMYNPQAAPYPRPPGSPPQPGGYQGQPQGPPGALDATVAHPSPDMPQNAQYPYQQPPGQYTQGADPNQYMPPGSPQGATRMQPMMGGIHEGMTLGDRYTIIKKLGAGGMGDVYRAQDTKLDEEVAIKVINSNSVTDESLAWFKQEVKLTRKLSHPNIIRLHDLMEVPGLVFITMEYVEGTDLRDILDKEKNRQMKLERAVRIITQCCDALHIAHDVGVIHRDIKPQNIMISGGDRDIVKILDFGLAKMADTKGLSKTGLAYGTPNYMSPEQIRGKKNIDHRIDIYALGCVFFELLTGKLPFDDEEMVQIFLKHLNETPPPPRKINPDIPEKAERIILKCIEKDPARRFQTCSELKTAIITSSYVDGG